MPAIFDQSEEDGRVVLAGSGKLAPDQVEPGRRAAHVCPSGAVSLAEEEPAAPAPVPARTPDVRS